MATKSETKNGAPKNTNLNDVLAGKVQPTGKVLQSQLNAATSPTAIVNGQTNTEVSVSAQNVRTKALYYAHLVSKESNADMERTVIAGETFKSGPLHNWFNMENDFTEQQLDEMPMPGTKQPVDANGVPIKDTNALYDHYKFTEIDTVTGTRKNRQGSYWGDFAKGTEWGAVIEQTLTDLLKAKNAAAPADKPVAYRDMETAELNDLIETWESRREQCKKQWADAYKLRHIVRTIQGDAFKGKVIIKIGMDSKNKPSKSLAPIYIINADNPGINTSLRVRQVLSLDTDEAIEKGATYAALLNTLQRDTGGAKGDGSKLWTLADFESNTALLAHFMNNDDMVTALVQKLHPRKAGDADAFIDSLGTVILRLMGSVWPTIEADFNRIKKAQRDANTAAWEARAAADAAKKKSA